MLEDYNERLNDFDFVLFHLYISDPSYKRYFNSLRENHPERTMILDNSAYEFFIKGETLDMDKYVEAIIELNPDYYLLPDVLMNKKQTVANALEFQETHQKKIEEYFKNIDEGAPQPIAVVQGNSIAEFNVCLLILLNAGYKNIAIPFHNSFFKDEIDECDGDIAYQFATAGYNHCTEDVRYAMGRAMWFKHHGMNILYPNGKSRTTKLHFLGSHCPAEKKYYEGLNLENTTMDTGYPVKCAIEGIELGSEKVKPNIIIDDFMNEILPYETQELIANNVIKFKNYTNE